MSIEINQVRLYFSLSEFTVLYILDYTFNSRKFVEDCIDKYIG